MIQSCFMIACFILQCFKHWIVCHSNFECLIVSIMLHSLIVWTMFQTLQMSCFKHCKRRVSNIANVMFQTLQTSCFKHCNRGHVLNIAIEVVFWTLQSRSCFEHCNRCHVSNIANVMFQTLQLTCFKHCKHWPVSNIAMFQTLIKIDPIVKKWQLPKSVKMSKNDNFYKNWGFQTLKKWSKIDQKLRLQNRLNWGSKNDPFWGSKTTHFGGSKTTLFWPPPGGGQKWPFFDPRNRFLGSRGGPIWSLRLL